jgi:hypothetical protein
MAYGAGMRFSKSSQMRASPRQSYLRQLPGRLSWTVQARVPGSLWTQ